MNTALVIVVIVFGICAFVLLIIILGFIFSKRISKTNKSQVNTQIEPDNVDQESPHPVPVNHSNNVSFQQSLESVVIEELRKLRTIQKRDINRDQIDKTEIASETFVTAEMDNGALDGGTTGTTDVQAMVEQNSAPLVALESAELIEADVKIVLNSALDNIEKEMINMCEAEIQVDVSDFVEKDELVGLGYFEIITLNC